MKLLIEAGADVNYSNKDGDTALVNATSNSTNRWKLMRGGGCNYDKFDIVDLLIKAGADVNIVASTGCNRRFQQKFASTC